MLFSPVRSVCYKEAPPNCDDDSICLGFGCFLFVSYLLPMCRLNITVAKKKKIKTKRHDWNLEAVKEGDGGQVN